MDGNQMPAAAAAMTARYGAGAEPKPGPWNDTLALLLSHRSVRGFKSDPVPEGTLETLVAAAQSAATSSNLQTWSVVAVDSKEVRAELATIAGNQKHIEVCPIFLVFLADVSRNTRLAKDAGVELAGLPYLESFLVSSIDAALAAQNAVVAAESLGLSTVYIGALRNDVTRVAELLGLPPGAAPVFGLCVGHVLPGREGEVKPRLPQDAVLHHETYDADDAGHRAVYDPRMEAFSRRQEMAGSTWTQRVILRLGTFAALHGREKLKEKIIALGFPLR
ncbi:NADPH-dependent oxidoreductase [Roseomonas sp. CAU 1739]|uniref:NADPH-dependent oxidoreductase n=1 Tax=Roseomonas sp. CAU 1739 TaxID=3140364 RepID=UPI00325B8AE2